MHYTVHSPLVSQEVLPSSFISVFLFLSLSSFYACLIYLLIPCSIRIRIYLTLVLSDARFLVLSILIA